jgi:hypothetical protein
MSRKGKEKQVKSAKPKEKGKQMKIEDPRDKEPSEK